MTTTETPTLPELLREIAELEPDGPARIDHRGMVYVVLRDGPSQFMYTPSGVEFEAIAQVGLKALCEARGWNWQLGTRGDAYDAHVSLLSGGLYLERASTPAHALAAATVQALRAERGA